MVEDYDIILILKSLFDVHNTKIHMIRQLTFQLSAALIGSPVVYFLKIGQAAMIEICIYKSTRV